MIDKPGQVFSRIHVDDIAGSVLFLINLYFQGKTPFPLHVVGAAYELAAWHASAPERYIKALTSTPEIFENTLARNPDLSRAVRTSHAHERIALSARQFPFVCNRKRARAALPWACDVIHALRKRAL